MPRGVGFDNWHGDGQASLDGHSCRGLVLWRGRHLRPTGDRVAAGTHARTSARCGCPTWHLQERVQTESCECPSADPTVWLTLSWSADPRVAADVDQGVGTCSDARVQRLAPHAGTGGDDVPPRCHDDPIGAMAVGSRAGDHRPLRPGVPGDLPCDVDPRACSRLVSAWVLLGLHRALRPDVDPASDPRGVAGRPRVAPLPATAGETQYGHSDGENFPNGHVDGTARSFTRFHHRGP
jgi:hypothetical protein